MKNDLSEKSLRLPKRIPDEYCKKPTLFSSESSEELLRLVLSKERKTDEYEQLSGAASKAEEDRFAGRISASTRPMLKSLRPWAGHSFGTCRGHKWTCEKVCGRDKADLLCKGCPPRRFKDVRCCSREKVAENLSMWDKGVDDSTSTVEILMKADSLPSTSARRNFFNAPEISSTVYQFVFLGTIRGGKFSIISRKGWSTVFQVLLEVATRDPLQLRKMKEVGVISGKAPEIHLTLPTVSRIENPPRNTCRLVQ
ncbi:uncharacterized protein EV420DRAFT_1479868 [Desarmillaria tabescens]|uniref:Uncharacterized protein n=1 Tax=Armillaria tabescens TaxID=1929756 RepID=A0AA39KF48_ARMTA|nr:uncharacterized protein EV420DRAFT_1479868 [Desarmillaria tabescens]KAK0458649.1 hypothetical protein EV420DRAFT_1479868 [Desarmillaria tabescens]